MTIPEILAALTPYTGSFPLEAMQAAVAQRETITPELLRVVEAVAENPAETARREDEWLHHFAIYLLAQFREQRAYEPIVRMFHAPGEIPFDLVSDTVTSRLNGILAAVYDGHPEPLQGLVEDRNANEYVRAAAVEAFVTLVRSGQMPREAVAEYFRSLLRGRLEREYSWTWNALVSAAASLPAPEALEEIRQAYADDLVERCWYSLDSIEQALRGGTWGDRARYELVTDAIADLEWWAAFNPGGSEAGTQTAGEAALAGWSRPAPAPAPAWEKPVPIVRGPKTGRNDPCPCGSGKKYKKCCGKA